MKKWKICILGVSSILFLTACTSKSMKTEDSMMKGQMKTEQVSSQKMGKEEMTMDFELTGIDGKVYHLSDYKGKKVYLKFWASWCSICLASLPDTDEIAQEVGEDVVVLTIVSPGQKGEKNEEEFKAWYQGVEYKHFPVLLDPSGKNLEAYGVRAYPTQVFLDRQGKIVKTQPGFMDKNAILETLKGIE